MKPTSIDRKLPLKLDTGSDVNAINKKTFQKLFPDAKLTPSSNVLQNFDSSCITPMGTFTTFLRWKGNVYRCKFEVMNSDDYSKCAFQANNLCDEHPEGMFQL